MSEEKLGQHYLATLNEAFPGIMLDHTWQTKDQLTVTIKVNYLPEVVEFLYYKQGGWLSVLFGNNKHKLNGHYTIYYMLSMEKGTKCWITVHVEVDTNKPEYPSMTPHVPAAVWGKHEVHDMYSLIPVGLPDEHHLVLPDDWPDELYPLHKDSMDYHQHPAPTTNAETYKFINKLGNKKNNIMPIGPLHITSDEPGHFHLFINGKNIINTNYHLFYVHHSMEKLAETHMGYNKVTFLSDHVCRICSFAHSTTYTTSVENTMGIQVPEHAQMIHAILLEVEHLHSHLLNLSLTCHFTSFNSSFMQFFHVHETSMKMAEILTSAHKTYSLNLISRIHHNLLKDDMIQTHQLAQQIHHEVQELVDVLLSTPNMEQHTVSIGHLDPEITHDFSNIGPMVHASSHTHDTHANHPFVSYGLLPMEVHSKQGCNIISHLKVHINKVYTTLNMINYSLDNLPGGPLMVEGFTYIPHHFALGFAKAPHSDDIHWSMTSNNQKLYHWHCHATTYTNWPTLHYMLHRNTISNAPLIISSLNPCYSCTNHMTMVNVHKKKSKVVPYKELKHYSIEHKNSPLK